MDEKFIRTALLLGEHSLTRLAGARVAVFGIGGVGGHAAEALARSGVGKLDLVDKDTVSISNINRQAIATTKTVGRLKAQVMKERILEINPEAEVRAYNCFFLPETAGEFDFKEYDYVVDAVDTVAAKIALAVQAQQAGVPIISSMGAGNKLDPTQFEVADIYQTSVCPLARVMRRTEKAGHRGLEGGILQGRAHPAQGAGIGSIRPDGAGQRCLRALGGRADYGRGGSKGPL